MFQYIRDFCFFIEYYLKSFFFFFNLFYEVFLNFVNTKIKIKIFKNVEIIQTIALLVVVVKDTEESAEDLRILIFFCFSSNDKNQTPV